MTQSRAKGQGKRGTRYNFRYSGKMRSPLAGAISLQRLEARVGIEPTHKGFADLSLTTWVPRLIAHTTTSRRRDEKALVRSVAQMEGLIGAGDRGRTGDIFLGKEALYH